MGDHMITIRKAKKIYRMGEERIAAVNNVSLDIQKGEFCCLLGKSGSGKSTLLNLLAGLEKPTKGEIIIDDSHIEQMTEDALARFRQQNIGFVFQSYNLLPTLTALENVELPLIFKRVGKSERERLALEMLKNVGLGDRANHKPSEMSGGQQQRVSIARAFINRPKVLFADEPTGNLDTKTTFEMMDLFLSLAREQDQTVIIVTHDDEVSSYADRIIRLSDGKITDIIKNENKFVPGGQLIGGYH